MEELEIAEVKCRNNQQKMENITDTKNTTNYTN